MNPALTRLKARHLQGDVGGIVSVCSSHPMVLRSAMQMARESGGTLLVEATANQVNQFGGYTGMRPAQWVGYIGELARQSDMPDSRLVIGADHLGPHVWKHEPAPSAMQKSEELIRQCVHAGFQKIHLDTAARCAGDAGPQLPLETIAERAVRLCRVAEALQSERNSRSELLYVIGNEVPAPGGALEEGKDLEVTRPEELMSALAAYSKAFSRAGAQDAWERVVAVVVQPGVDFGDRRVAPYRSERAAALSAAHDQLPGIMTYEIHATDYQRPQALRQMVQDHFILLKVGPCLTFAMRRALYALAEIEAGMPRIDAPSRLPQVMEDLMTAHPEHWRPYFGGPPEEGRRMRHYSLRDRMRYYWTYPEARQAVQRLMQNLSRPIPSELLQRHLPEIYPDTANGLHPVDPAAVIHSFICAALAPYLEACR